jgi:hypothetical protein
MRTWIILAIALILVVPGCAPQVSVQRLDNVNRPVHRGDLPVYESLEAVDKAFEQIARLSADDKRSIRRDESEVLAMLATEAKALGADALVVLKNTMMTRILPNPEGGGDLVYHYPHIEAAAIVFKP